MKKDTAINDIKQNSIKYINRKLEGENIVVVDYDNYESDKAKIKLLVNNVDKEIIIKRDDLPHLSTIFSFSYYTDLTIEAIKKNL